jgi:hypothetical protein
LDTAVPTLYCALDVRGKVSPIFLNTYLVNPEQSKPLVLVPPVLYDVPMVFEITVSILESAKALPAPSVNTITRPSAAAVHFFLKF